MTSAFRSLGRIRAYTPAKSGVRGPRLPGSRVFESLQCFLCFLQFSLGHFTFDLIFVTLVPVTGEAHVPASVRARHTRPCQGDTQPSGEVRQI